MNKRNVIIPVEQTIKNYDQYGFETDIDDFINDLKKAKEKGATIIDFDVESSYGVMIDFYNVRLETDKEYNDRIGHENNQREYEIKRLTDRINILKNER